MQGYELCSRLFELEQAFEKLFVSLSHPSSHSQSF